MTEFEYETRQVRMTKEHWEAVDACVAQAKQREAAGALAPGLVIDADTMIANGVSTLVKSLVADTKRAAVMRDLNELPPSQRRTVVLGPPSFVVLDQLRSMYDGFPPDETAIEAAVMLFGMAAADVEAAVAYLRSDTWLFAEEESS